MLCIAAKQSLCLSIQQTSFLKSCASFGPSFANLSCLFEARRSMPLNILHIQYLFCLQGIFCTFCWEMMGFRCKSPGTFSPGKIAASKVPPPENNWFYCRLIIWKWPINFSQNDRVQHLFLVAKAFWFWLHVSTQKTSKSSALIEVISSHLLTVKPNSSASLGAWKLS